MNAYTEQQIWSEGLFIVYDFKSIRISYKKYKIIHFNDHSFLKKKMLTNKQHNIAAKLFEKKYALWKIKSEFNEGTPTYVLIDAHNAL